MTHDPNNHIKSRVECIAVLMRQVAQAKELPYDLAQIAASAVFQLAQLEAHLASLRDPATLVNRKTDRGYQPAKLPHGDTVEVGDPVVNYTEANSGILTFDLANSVQRAKLAGER